jgi:hypothetical protein
MELYAALADKLLIPTELGHKFIRNEKDTDTL